MKTNNSTGRNVSLAIGFWLIIKFVVNTLIGGIDISGLIIAIIGIVLLYVGIKYTNYVIAVALVLVVLVNLIGNIQGLFHADSIIRSLIYLLEAVVDIVCALALCASQNVKEHFTNSISDITGGNQ